MNIYAAVPLLSSIAYAVLLALSGRHPRRAERRAFSLYLTSALVWSLASAALHLDFPVFTQFALTGSKLLVVSIAWMIVTYYHFLKVFVQQSSRNGVYAGGAFILLVAVLNGVGWTPISAYAEGGIIYIDRGPAIYLYAAGAFAIGLDAIMSLARHYREVTTPVARTRIAYLFIGLTVVIISLMSNISDVLSRYPIDQIGNLANALIISYAILKYRLLDITIVLRRGLAYSTLSILLTAGYLLALSTVYRFTNLTLQTSFIPAAGLALLMALAFVPLRNIAQDRIDRLFYRHTHAYRKVLLDFSSRAANILALDQLAKEMIHLVVEAVQARWGALLVPDAFSGELRTEYVEFLGDQSEPREVRLRHDSPLLPYLAKHERVLQADMLDVLPNEKGMWETERRELHDLGVTLLCPVLTRGTLTGVIVLGPKQDGNDYSEEESNLLLTMAGGAAVAMDNARIMGALRQRERAHERLLSRVVTAQEEERQRIAADLHDGVAQWLVRASYQTQVARVLASGDQDNGLDKELDEIESTLRASIAELRRVLSGLRPPILDELGLPQALDRELAGLREAGIESTMQVDGEPVRLPDSMEIAIYRLVQEALNNVRNHSEASKVTVHLRFTGDQLHIRVQDNGVGFNVSSALSGAAFSDSMGLLGMKQRVESLGGEFQVESQEGTGTSVLLQLPLSRRD